MTRIQKALWLCMGAFEKESPRAVTSLDGRFTPAEQIKQSTKATPLSSPSFKATLNYKAWRQHISEESETFCRGKRIDQRREGKRQ